MKNILLFWGLFLCSGLLFAQIPNSDMENWTFQPTLIGWQTNSQPLTTPPIDPYVVRMDSDRYSGNWAADLHANGVFKAWATTIFAVPSHPDHLSLYYKLLFPPCVNDSNNAQKDTASVKVLLLYQGAVVDSGFWQSSIAQLNYGQLIVPLSQNSTVFDSCRITLTGGDVLGGCGIVAASTEFKVDHLELDYSSQPVCVDSARMCDTCICPQFVQEVCGCNGATYINYCYAQSAGVTSWSAGACGINGIGNVSKDALELQLFPNPVNEALSLRCPLPDPGVTEIRIFNMLGETLMLENAGISSGVLQKEIVTSGFASGVYLLELKCGAQSVLKRFVKE